jgi:hypothetical protein
VYGRAGRPRLWIVDTHIVVDGGKMKMKPGVTVRSEHSKAQVGLAHGAARLGQRRGILHHLRRKERNHAFPLCEARVVMDLL